MAALTTGLIQKKVPQENDIMWNCGTKTRKMEYIMMAMMMSIIIQRRQILKFDLRHIDQTVLHQ